MPDAPKPAFNKAGSEVPAWMVIAAFRPAQDALTLSWHRPSTPHFRELRGAVAYPPLDLPDLLEGVATQIQLLGAPRLF